MVMGDGSIVGTVMNQAERAAKWLSGGRPVCDVKTVMLVPYGDKLLEQYKSKYNIIEGPEDDVLTRYVMAQKEFDADLVVRLTGDCVWLTSSIIAKCIRAAVKHGSDYCSNVLVRSFIEGHDVEVLSSGLLKYLDTFSTTATEREHVTTHFTEFAEQLSSDYLIHTVFSEYDFSDIKSSIDTREEYDDCLGKFDKLRAKKHRALSLGSISN